MRNLSAYKICFLVWRSSSKALPVKNDVVINSVDFDNTSYTQIVQSIIKNRRKKGENGFLILKNA